MRTSDSNYILICNIHLNLVLLTVQPRSQCLPARSLGWGGEMKDFGSEVADFVAELIQIPNRNRFS